VLRVPDQRLANTGADKIGADNTGGADNTVGAAKTCAATSSYVPIGFDVVEVVADEGCEPHQLEKLTALPAPASAVSAVSGAAQPYPRRWSSVFVAARQVSLRIPVRRGCAYYVVPCTYKPGISLDFTVEVVFDLGMGGNTDGGFALGPVEARIGSAD
jgi:hypothetical protein